VSEASKIEWTDATWNPVRGCTPASAGCANCYAIRDTWRLAHNPNPRVALSCAGLVEQAGGQWRPGCAPLRWTGRIRCLPELLEQPLRWRRPRRIFVCSQSDLFHPAVPEAFIDRVIAMTQIAYWHTYQVLTKRPERMREYFSRTTGKGNVLSRVLAAAVQACQDLRPPRGYVHRGSFGWPYRNVWLGTTVEDRRARNRIAELERTPAAVRYVSFEPLLEDLGDLELAGTGIGWAIVGGESGPAARALDVAWVRSIVDQCRAVAVSVFVKQLGAAWAREPVDGKWSRSADAKGGDPRDWPEDLRVRELPQEVAR
jgi:protein gp37